MERKQNQEVEAQAGQLETSADLEQLPPRLLKHASKKSKRVRYVSIALWWLFFILTIALIIWGYRNA